MTKKYEIPSDLLIAKKIIYDPCHFTCSELIMETESAEYGAYTFELNGLVIRFRIAKTTPTKTGQFVTLWKRIGNGPIQPYDLSDSVDFFVISTRKDSHFGQFVFPKSALCQHNIVSIKGQGGKRAIRVYPPWDNALNKQAQKTQAWQMNYFLEIPLHEPIDYDLACKLYSLVW